MTSDFKKILTINDISCIGKCSITAIHPILSCAGFETIILPTSLLSNHTAYSDFSFLDLTDEMETIIDKWNSFNIKFDSILSGYLGSEKQIDLVLKTKDLFLKENGLFIVDPVMGDNGKLYKGFAPTYPKLLSKLLKDADIITPNLTEACLMIDVPYKANFEESEIDEIINKLTFLGAKRIVITGIIKGNKIGVVYKDNLTNEKGYFFTKKINKIFHGTGDVYTSALVGAYLNNHSLKDSTKIAIDFTYKSILEAIKLDLDPLGGLPFERKVQYYLNKIK